MSEALVRFAKAVTADYAAEQLRQQANERVQNSSWAKKHPEWVARHAEISARTPEETKAVLSAGRRKVPQDKMLKPIRADKGTLPPKERRSLKNLFRRHKDVSKAMKLPDGTWVRLRTYKRAGATSDVVEAMHQPKKIPSRRYGLLNMRKTKAVQPKRKNIANLQLHNSRSAHSAVKEYGPGHVDYVNTLPEWQRKGIGRAMWDRAEGAGLTPYHSDNLSIAGTAYRDSVGGRSMPIRTYKEQEDALVHRVSGGIKGKPMQKKSLEVLPRKVQKSDDVVIPKDVESKIRAQHPPELHENKLEEARTYYRVLREDRREELRAAKRPTQVDPPEVQPSTVQEQRIKAHKARKKAPRRRKVRIYPQPGTARQIAPSRHEEGMWQRHLEHQAIADAKVTKALSDHEYRDLEPFTGKTMQEWREYQEHGQDEVATHNAKVLARKRGLKYDETKQRYSAEKEPKAQNSVRVDANTADPQKRAVAAQARKKKLVAAGKWKEPPPMKTRKHVLINSPVTYRGKQAVHKSIRLPDKSIVRIRTTKLHPGTKAMFSEDQGAHRVSARRRGEEIGFLHTQIGKPRKKVLGIPMLRRRTEMKPGTVRYVNVEPEFRRQGIGTAMWNRAKEVGLEPRHSKAQSWQGKKWSDAVGKSIRLPDKSIVRFRTKKNPPIPNWATDDYSRQYLDRTEMIARRKGKTVGQMALYNKQVGNPELHGPMHHPAGTVAYLHTRKKHRGKGIATGMWNHAKKHELKPLHSTDQTDAGKSWARSVGD